MYERFTERARRAVELAREEALRRGARDIGCDHFLLGLIRSEDVKVDAVLALFGRTPSKAAQLVRDGSGSGRGDRNPDRYVSLGPATKETLRLAVREALDLGHNFVEPVHLLLGLDRLRDEPFVLSLQRLDIAPDEFRPAVLRAMVDAGVKLLDGSDGPELASAAPVTVPAGPGPRRRAREPVRLFVSYSHKDERHRRNLETHLAATRRAGDAVEWHDRRIVAGTVWAEVIDDELKRADIVVLLLSPDFLASDYCYGVELGRAMERHQKQEARVIPVLVRPCDWNHEPIRSLQLLPRDAKPVTEWSNRDRAWLDVVTGIRAAIAGLRSPGGA